MYNLLTSMLPSTNAGTTLNLYVNFTGLLLLALAIAFGPLVAGEESGAIIKNVEGDDNAFSIPAFVICVRESMEGCVITAVLLNALHKSGQYHMKKWVWFGVLVGTTSFLIIGAVCLIIFYTLNRAMPPQVRAGFEGIFALLACAILTHISFKFLRLKDLIMKWEAKLVQDKDNTVQQTAGSKGDHAKGFWGQFVDCFADFRDALNIRHQSLSKDAVMNNPQGLGWKGERRFYSSCYRMHSKFALRVAPDFADCTNWQRLCSSPFLQCSAKD